MKSAADESTNSNPTRAEVSSANGSQSTIKVWFDGAAEYSSTVSLGVSSLSAVQLGAEHTRQMGDEYIDDVVVRAS